MSRAILILLAPVLAALPASAQTLPRLPWTAASDVSASVPHSPFGMERGSLSTTVFRGRHLPYEVIDRLAIHGGDVILGTAEEAAAAAPASRVLTSSRAFSAVGRAAAPSEDWLWPDGVIAKESLFGPDLSLYCHVWWLSYSSSSH